MCVNVKSINRTLLVVQRYSYKGSSFVESLKIKHSRQILQRFKTHPIFLTLHQWEKSMHFYFYAAFSVHTLSLYWLPLSVTTKLSPNLLSPVSTEGWRTWWRRGWRATIRSRSWCSLPPRAAPPTPTTTTSAWWTLKQRVKRIIPQISIMKSLSSPWFLSTRTPWKSWVEFDMLIVEVVFVMSQCTHFKLYLFLTANMSAFFHFKWSTLTQTLWSKFQQ